MERFVFYLSVVSGIVTVLAFFRVDYRVFKPETVASKPTYREKWMFGLTLLSLVMCGVGIWNQATKPERLGYITGWGESTDRSQGAVTVDTSHLLDETEAFRLGAVEVHDDSLSDPLDSPGLQKSTLFDIQPGPVTIGIHLDGRFRRSLEKVDFDLLLVPKRVTMDAFATLHKAEDLGVQILATRQMVVSCR
jgi:hypothetical protein